MKDDDRTGVVAIGLGGILHYLLRLNLCVTMCSYHLIAPLVRWVVEIHIGQQRRFLTIAVLAFCLLIFLVTQLLGIYYLQYSA